MALLNPKNLVLPMTNKVHLMTMILAALLFVIFRFSHGQFSTGGRSAVAPRPAPLLQQPVPERPLPERQAPPRTVAPVQPLQPQGDWDSFLDELDRPGAARLATPPPSPAPRSALEEIERELGLR